jgi:HAE1 family hydrophobic/amphiphilic exporter-1
MNITRFGLNRPVTVYMIFAAILLLGAISFSNLSIDLFPDIDFPMVYVLTSYEGAGPAEIESMLSKPIEKAVSTVPNLKNVTASSFSEISGVGVELETGTDIDKAANNIKEKIDMIKSSLPEAADDPIIFKFDPSMIPVVVLGISSTKMDLRELRSYVVDDLSPNFERIEGVAAASVYGGEEREIEVHIDRAALEARNLSVDQVKAAIAANNLNTPGGRITTPQSDFQVRTTGQFQTVNEIGNVVVGSNPQTGTQIFLREIASIKDASVEKRSSLPVNGKEGVVLQLQKASGGNTVKVAERVRKVLAELNKDLPDGVKITMLMDQSNYIQESIDGVKRSAMEGGVLAVFIILLFLASIRSTAIISIAIPFSVITTFCLLYFGKLTLNIATMGGLALGIGRLVDDSIVVLENIYRHLKMGKNPWQASLDGASEVGMAVLASTITTIIVFVPILFVEGMAGAIFKPMAYTVSFSLLASMMVSLILLPVLTTRFLRVNDSESQTVMGRWNRFTERWLDKLDSAYHNIILWALHHKVLVVSVVLLLFMSIVVPLGLVGKEFIPDSDSGEIELTVKLPVGSKLEDTLAVTDQIYEIFQKDFGQDITSTYSRVGLEGKGLSALSAMFTGISGPNAASMGVNLVKISERELSTNQIIEQVRAKTAKIPDAEIHFNSGGMMAGMGGGYPIVIELYGYDLDAGQKLAAEIQAMMAKNPNVVDIQTSLEMGSPELQIKVDLAKAAAVGLSVSQVANAINTEIGGTTASVYRDPLLGKEYNINVQFDPAHRQSTNDLSRAVITTPAGSQVPLASVAQIIRASGPVKIERKNQERLITISARTVGKAPGTVAEAVERDIRQKIILPDGFTFKMGGSYQEQTEAFASLAFALLLAIVLVYMVLASQFESLLDPFIIMFSVPLGLVGVLWGLFLFGHSLSVVSFLGIIMMSGIVVSNGILLVDYTNQLRRQGMELYEAVATAGRTRLRPVLMTTLTTVIGLVPMALGIGEGAEMQAPMAMSVVSGLTFSTVMTLIFIPVLYTIVEKRVRRRISHQKPAIAE